MKLKKEAIKIVDNKLFIPIILILILLIGIITLAITISNSEGDEHSDKMNKEDKDFSTESSNRENDENNWFKSLFSFWEDEDSESINKESDTGDLNGPEIEDHENSDNLGNDEVELNNSEFEENFTNNLPEFTN